ncbi:MAG: S8 family serine peptidase, partial [Gammaproteobacteria bacterium]|nr:S8 family serine peptidase [Gemmatimonadota bacterium]NIU75178.1 S8 family serine peptidase [Gammaproteobacteria bacterium]
GLNFRTCLDEATPCGDSDLEYVGQDHGAAVAGLVAAEGGNEKGVIGVCPACRLMLLTLGGGEWPRIHAFLYAAEQGASVVSASWTMDRKTAVEAVIRDVSHTARGGRGLPVVFSVGDDGDLNVCEDEEGSPEKFAGMDEVIAVATSDNDDKRVPGANLGNCLDLLAPGGFEQNPLGVTTTDQVGSEGKNNADDPCARGELADVDYTNCSGGSSASAAIVSGVVG